MKNTRKWAYSLLMIASAMLESYSTTELVSSNRYLNARELVSANLN